MNATLSFALPEEEHEYRSANVGSDLARAFQDIDNRLRSMSKYEDRRNISIETMRSMLRDETEDFAPWLWE